MDGLTGNTLDSHRLIAYAGRQGYDVQDKVVEELFKAYFTEVSPLPLLYYTIASMAARLFCFVQCHALMLALPLGSIR